MPPNNSSNARNIQSKTVQPNKHKPSNLTVIETTSSSDEWQQQHKSKTKHTPPSTPNSPSTQSSRQPEIKKTKLFFFSPNRYTILSEKEDDITDNDATNAPDINVPPQHETIQTNQTNKNKNNLPPPIFVKGTKKYSDLREAISDQIGPDSIICKSTTAHIKIQANTSDNYRTLIHILQDQGAEYHTFQPQTEKSIRVVIKNIHYTTDPKEILEALEEIGFTVRQVINIKHQQTKMPLPIFFVDLAPKALSKEIFNITSLLNTKIKVEEPHKRRDIPQCQSQEKQYCTRAILDISQAFDRVWLAGLLFKLKIILPSNYYLLIKSYLQDRFFSVRYGTATSSPKPIKAGVPQGAITAPLLFNIFLYDQPTLPTSLIADFADDKAFIATSHDPTFASAFIQEYLSLLGKWYKEWGVKINESKSTHLTDMVVMLLETPFRRWHSDNKNDLLKVGKPISILSALAPDKKLIIKFKYSI
ncbi:hypothetical protein QTP88_017943 [Uroleucon formosanum]